VHGRHLGLCRQAIFWIERIDADEAHVHSPRLMLSFNILSNSTEANRQETESFFGAYYNRIAKQWYSREIARRNQRKAVITQIGTAVIHH
jgi:hypothetical protein